MRTVLAILGLLASVGCVPREERTCRVVEQGTIQPIAGAKVWIQPTAPHPFWPWSDRGVTDKDGETHLSLPTGYWWWWTSVTATGYSEIDYRLYDTLPDGRPCWTFYMRADRPATSEPAR
ncbi:MAG: hypothetical protein JWM57_1326 [Phycisphaerales bacterium]|nr:hypothetical protein [Phycisphaerales bacterium]